ncbi:MAG: proton-conducting transporter membrane subunit [Thermoproteota archaeon]
MISVLLSIAIFLPMFGSLFLSLTSKRRSFLIDAILPIVSSTLLTVVAVYFYDRSLTFFETKILSASIFEIGYLIDYFSLSISFIVLLISSIVALYSLSYFKGDEKQYKFWFWFNLFVSSMLFLVLSNNLLSTFIGWEAIGICSWALISYYYDSSKTSTGKVFSTLGDQSVYSSLKALFYTSVSDVFLLAFIIVLYFLTYKSGTPTLDYTLLQQVLNFKQISPNIVIILSLFLILGIIGKAAQLPFSSWLPDAMVAPTPVSALLHSATIVKAPLVLIGRLLIFDPFLVSNSTFQSLAIVVILPTVAVASVNAIAEKDIKRLLAYSTISQIGLILIGFSLSQSLSATWYSTFQFISHAVLKATLFLVAGIIIHVYNTNNLEEIKINIRENVVLFLSTTMAVFSLVGFPPFSGFLSKELLLHSIKNYSAIIYAVVLILSFFTPIYSFKFLTMFTTEKGAKKEDSREIRNMSLLTFILSLFTLVLNFLFLFLAAQINLSLEFTVLFSFNSLVILVLFAAISLLSIVSFKAIPNSISYVLLTINKLTACEGVSIYSYYKHFSRMCKKFNKVEKYSTSFYILLVLVGFLIYLSVMLVIAIK